MYANDNNQQFPSGAGWCDAIVKYTGSRRTFKCLQGDQSQASHYAFNARLQGLRSGQLQSPSKTVLIFETDGGWNLAGGPELLVHTPRHGRAVVVGFADGHVETVTSGRLGTLRWEP
jgi:prepilin-type processing-associated H-X9-DG protein